MSSWSITIEGTSVAKGRGRIVRFGPRPGIMTPATTRRFEDIVRQKAIAEWSAPMLQLDVALMLRITFIRPIPASWSKAKRAKAAAHLLHPTSKPDLDNLVKAITDGMNGVVFVDDAAIVSMHVCKTYGDRPEACVTLEWSEA